MSTPTSNSVPTTYLNTSGLSTQILALVEWNFGGTLEAVKWGGGWGTGVALTYSFPSGTATYANNYGSDNGAEWTDGWYALNSPQISAVKSALATWATCANVTFSQTVDNSSTVGDLRFAISNHVNASSGEYAYGYAPNDNPSGGDVWFSTQWNSDTSSSVLPGTYAYMTILHEIGHALGLKHPQDAPVTLDSVHNCYTYSIMSYDVHPGASVSSVSADWYPTTPQFLDDQAIQALYGKPLHANTGNTKYIFYGNQHYWETINDSSGNDTFVYRSTTGGRIDLSNATFSQLGLPIHFSDGTVNYDDVALAPNTVIENATGGGGNDTIIGGSGKNVLNGGGGNDTITGGGGADRITGGAGSDTFVYKSASDSAGANFDVIKDFNASQDHFDLWNTIRKIDHKVTGGALSLDTFARNLHHDLPATKLAAHSAVLFTPTSGTEKGLLFLVVDPTGSAGYIAANDLVIELTGAHLAGFGKADFI